MNEESLTAEEPGSGGCSLKCSCIFVSALVSNNCVYVGSTQVLFLPHQIAVTHSPLKDPASLNSSLYGICARMVRRLNVNMLK